MSRAISRSLSGNYRTVVPDPKIPIDPCAYRQQIDSWQMPRAGIPCRNNIGDQ